LLKRKELQPVLVPIAAGMELAEKIIRALAHLGGLETTAVMG